ncbi:SET and MYND domain-containing protein 4 [Aethina tumida]|uniref:SET and MYND domain-containing protein 4 n=1 Tax=Aethina tumida TaxID=116153 RepID=UPI0021482464|nr:SET and MYND domain-containing protein 4 [Aethina tumida]
MNDTNKPASMVEVQQALLRHLIEAQKVKDVSQQFSVLDSNHERVNFVLELVEQYQLFPQFVADEKNEEASNKLRQKGNEMYKLHFYKQAIEFYTQSIAMAEEKTEAFAVALANRSAVLFEIKLYAECIQDINIALENGYPENLKSKILQRKEKAESLKETQRTRQYYENVPVIELSAKNANISCASDAIEIKFTPELGRHIVAKRDVFPGEVLAVETPFCQVLLDEKWIHCHHCFQICYNLLPCKICTTALFCSKVCEEAAEVYHRYECPISAMKNTLQLDKLKLIALRIALQAKSEFHNIWNETEENGQVYMSNRYKEIHELVGNTKQRSVSDLFERSLTASLLFHLIHNHTDFFKDCDSDISQTSFKEIILKNLQIGPCNFHEISELASNEEGTYLPQEIGTGCYSFMSMFNHSCSPNVSRNCYGTTIVLRCLESIKEGEQCFDNYGYHYALMTKPERLQHLKNQYFFDCNCLACEENWPLYQDLSLVKEGVYIPSTDLEDLQFGNRVTAKKVIKAHLSKLEEVEKFKPSKNLAELQEVIKQCYALMANVRGTV